MKIGIKFTVIIIYILVNIPVLNGEKKPVIIKGDNVKTRLLGIENGKKIYLTELTGRPRIIYGDKKLRSKKIIVRGNEGELSKAIGNVKLTDKASKTIVRSREALYYKVNNRAEFTGKPVIETRREDDNSRVIIKAKKIVYDIENNIGYAYDKVTLKNKETNVYSKRAIFNRDKNEIIFPDEPVVRKNDDTYKAEEIVYYVNKHLLLLKRNAHVTAYSEEKINDKEVQKKRTIIKGSRIENYEKDDLTIIFGNEIMKASVENEDGLFTGTKIEVRGSEADDVLGTRVYINYPEENIETYGDNFISHKKDDYSALWGDACIVLKDEDTKTESSRIYGDYIEYFQKHDLVYIFGNVRIFQETGIIRGSMAKYHRSDNNMLITGNAMFEKEDSILLSQKIIYNTKSNETSLTGDIKGISLESD